jgi:hypothetical protein
MACHDAIGVGGGGIEFIDEDAADPAVSNCESGNGIESKERPDEQ